MTSETVPTLFGYISEQSRAPSHSDVAPTRDTLAPSESVVNVLALDELYQLSQLNLSPSNRTVTPLGIIRVLDPYLENTMFLSPPCTKSLERGISSL